MGTITILFVDQVGSTMQLSTLGDSSAVKILDELQALVNRHLDDFRGVFHKHTGDGFMASFESCIGAVECALSLQGATAAFNTERPFERRLVLRMGLHTGEPLVHATGPYGAAVVVAARLCDLAGAGQVLVSDVVRVVLEPRRTFELTPVGTRRLKGFTEPMLCYLVHARDGAASRALPAEFETGRGTPFIGRAVELARLRVAFVEAAEGGTAALVIAGERGVGKTRLVCEFAAEAHQQGAQLFYAKGVDGLERFRAELGSRGGGEEPMIAVVDDVPDAGTIGEIAQLLPGSAPLRFLAVIVTTLTDVGNDVAGIPVLQVAGLSRDEIRYLLEVGGATGDVDARARELVSSAHGAPGAVRAQLAELSDTALRDELREAIDEALTAQEDEQRTFAAITAGIRALRSDLGANQLAISGETAPYKGLVAYGSEDGEWFCGRDELTATLVARFTISRFIAVTGSSGIGKSSLVRAGLIAALQANAVDGSASWPILVFTPHGRPLTELAGLLVAHAGGDSPDVLADRLSARPTLLADIATRTMEDRAEGSRLVIVVDQFEEVFTHCRSDEERTAFFDALVHAARVPSGSASVVVVLRGDYYGHCSAHQELAQAVSASHVLVGPMSPSEVRLAVEEPARRAGLTVDPELVDHAVDDASGEPGMLPLLSTAMLETWKRRQRGRLTLGAYAATGGVRGAIARLAETVYERLSPEERTTLRAMLLRLAEVGEDGDDVRRRAALDELVPTPMYQGVLDALVSHRLVTVDAGRAEVAHEALLREWPRLRSWLEEDRAGRRLHRRLTTDARAWEDAGRAEDLLYRGVRLDSALEWGAGREEELHPSERAFLEASQSAWQRELAASRRSARRFRVLAVALAVLLVAALAAGALAQVQRNRARDRARAAESSRIAKLSDLTLDQNLSAATLLAVEGWRQDRTDVTEGALLSAVQRFGSSETLIPLGGGNGIDVSSKNLLASGSYDEVVLWDLKRSRAVGVLPIHAQGVKFSPEGSRLAVLTIEFGDTQPDSALISTTYHVEFWDVASRRLISKVTADVDPGYGPDIERQLAWSRDGTRVAYADDAATMVWDVASGATIGNLAPGKAAVITRKGDLLATSDDKEVRLWDATTLEPRGQMSVPPPSGPSDPSGSLWLVQGAGDTLIRSSFSDPSVLAWDLRTRQPVQSGLDPKGGFFDQIEVSPDATKAFANGTMWDLASAKPTAVLEFGDRGGISSGRFTADGSAFILPTLTGPLQMFATVSSSDRGIPVGETDLSPTKVVPRPDGRLTVISGDSPFQDPGKSANFEAAIVVPKDHQLSVDLPLGEGNAVAVNDVGDVAAVLTSSNGATHVNVVDLASGRPQASLALPGSAALAANALTLAPDGKHLAVSDADGTVHVADSVTGELTATLPTDGAGPVAVNFMSDGRIVTVRASSDDRNGWTMLTWGLDGKRLGKTIPLDGSGTVGSAHLTADGRLLLVASRDGISMVSLDEGRVVGRLAGPGFASDVRMSDAGPGRVLITSSSYGEQMWDLQSRLPVGEPLQAAQGSIETVTIEDGQRVLYSFIAQGGTLFQSRRTLDPGALTMQACALAKRNLTAAEWAQFFPGTRYHKTCPAFAGTGAP